MNCVHCGEALGEPDAESHSCAPREHTKVYLVRPGDILEEKWRIETLLGQGAMGSVFLGIEPKRGGKVAIKILSPDHCRKPKVLARFEREARLMTTLRHPNIVQLLGVGRQGALPYIVMQYLEGETLADYLKGKGGKLSPVETLSIIRQVCSGLAFVHHHGLVHRDIKPQNVFISSEGHVTILDLGVVRDKSTPGLTKPGAMVGTPYYMSPEQILGTAEIDRRTDVYALGAVTFELLTGTPPFVADSNFEVLYKHRTLPPPDASLLSAFVPKQVAEAINHALAKTPDERQQNVSELLADLEAGYCLDDDRTNPGIAFSFPEEPTGPGKKKPRPAAPAAPKAQTPVGARMTPLATRAVSLPAPARAKSINRVEPSRAEALKQAVQLASAEVELLSSQDSEVSKTENNPAGPSTTGRETDVRERRMGDRSTADETMGESADPGATVVEMGELRLVTTVKGLTAGATLFVDRVPKGSTPTSLKLPAGKYGIRLERAGLKPIEREVTVAPSNVTLLRIDLEKG
ncbi:MAG: serine/threonine protein kinase [Myxococcaceae bacterium]